MGISLIAEKSVFTKRGPYTGARGAVPSSPTVKACGVPGLITTVGAGTKAQGLNQFCSVWTFAGAAQPGFAATVPPWSGFPTSSGRFSTFPFHMKFTPDWLLLFTTNSGNPEMAFSITLTFQPPKIELTGPPQLLP